MSGARLSEADLSAANLNGAQLSGADLSKTELSWADLRKASLSATTFCQPAWTHEDGPFRLTDRRVRASSQPERLPCLR